MPVAPGKLDFEAEIVRIRLLAEEARNTAAEMKQFAKRDGGSSYAVDRRAP